MTRLAALALSLLPALAFACPVCGQGRDGTGAALLVMTIIMSALPLSMIGGVVGYVWFRSKKAKAEATLLAAAPSQR